MRSRYTPQEPNAGAEHPCFLPATGMADTEAGSGILMLDDRAHNYLIDLRLGPDPEHPSVYYSTLWTRAGGEVPIGRATGRIYLIAFHDRDRDGYLGNGEYDFLILSFRRQSRTTPTSVRAEPVEALSSFYLSAAEEVKGFDKLSPNGACNQSYRIATCRAARLAIARASSAVAPVASATPIRR
jgi:hypothetical protein